MALSTSFGGSDPSLSSICTSYLPRRYTPLLLPDGYRNSICSLKSEKVSSVAILEPECGLRRIPESAVHWLTAPRACQPLRSDPSNNLTGRPQTGGFDRTREGARTPVQLYCFPSGAIKVPVRLSPWRLPSTERSLSSRSHCGGIEKLSFPALKLI